MHLNHKTTIKHILWQATKPWNLFLIKVVIMHTTHQKIMSIYSNQVLCMFVTKKCFNGRVGGGGTKHLLNMLDNDRQQASVKMSLVKYKCQWKRQQRGDCADNTDTGKMWGRQAKQEADVHIKTVDNCLTFWLVTVVDP